jgi:hypothetical protein
VIELTTTRRDSGRRSSRTTWFVRKDEKLYLVQAFRTKYSARNVESNNAKHDVTIEVALG